ncbi:MAG: hypothetical protein LBK63_05975, partial [Treponema sp.]|nr:hypothetical protein [Treponema sp.]
MKHTIAGMFEEIRRELPAAERKQGEALYDRGDCVLLSWSLRRAEFAVSAGEGDTDSEDSLYSLCFEGQEGAEKIIPAAKGRKGKWDQYSYSCLLRYEEELKKPILKEQNEYKRYTREGMSKRVLDERREKAGKAAYRIEWAGNVYGDHILTNEKG